MKSIERKGKDGKTKMDTISKKDEWVLFFVSCFYKNEEKPQIQNMNKK